jgi:acetylornithine deacetylase/succinyl-diaminopimelate desuccinylase-like protein
VLADLHPISEVKTIASYGPVQAALDHLRGDVEAIISRVVSIQQIPAPTFAEGERAAYIEEQFKVAGLGDVHQDDLHNVYGHLPGRTDQAPLVITAHSDTVFPAETDLDIQRSDGRVAGPGIADNSLGVAGLLILAETIRDFQIQSARDIWFASNVGEEGLGNLRGMQAVVDRFGEAAAYIVLEGGLYGYVCHEAIGVRRFRLEVETPGGHSWGAFGTPSAIHVLGRLIAGIDQLEVPTLPKTTYNVGVIEGGTTINAIARRARLQLDLRSEDSRALGKLIRRVKALVDEANRQEQVTVQMVEIGNRPAGRMSQKAPLVQAATAALEAVGCETIEYTVGSTDANIPLSRGYPAVCIGLTRSGNTHRPDEYMEVAPIPLGLGQALLLVLATAGYID